MQYTDLREVKRVLEIAPSNTDEDVALNFYIEQASSWIEEYLGRPDIAYKVRTRPYKGTGCQKLNLRDRPVFPTAPPPEAVALGLPFQAISVVVDESALFGSAPGAFGAGDPTSRPLVYGQDYCLQIDRDDGGSRSAILIRMNDVWPRPAVRQDGYLSPFVWDDTGSIQVTTTAGYLVDTLPASLRFAGNLLVARMRYLMPLGMELTQESYEDRAIGMAAERKDYLLALVKPLLVPFRNWKW